MVQTLIEAILIVIAVIYLCLGSLRSVIIPVLTYPFIYVGGSGLMLAFGFSINLLLLAMVLAIGLVVDDAIVVVEKRTSSY